MSQEKLFQPQLFRCLKNYDAQKFSRDLFSGLILACVAIPLSLAFAIASGVSPAQGLLTAVIGGFVISLLGGSRVQIGGPTAAFIIIIFGIVAKWGVSGLIIATFMAGVILILFGIFRFGTAVRYIPQPIIIGFTAGIAVVIILGQAKDILGLSIDRLPLDFVSRTAAIVAGLPGFNPWSLLIGAVSFLLIALVSRWWPRLPGAFLVLVLVTWAAQAMKLPVATVASTFGTVGLSITPLDLGGITYQTFVDLLPAAFSIAFLGALESLLSASVADGMVGDRHNSTTELIAQGAANIASSFFGGIPAAGAVARTTINVQNGGRTPVAGIVQALVLFLLMLFFGSFTGLVPMAALAGLLLHVAYKMGEWKEFRLAFRTTRADALALMTTFLVTIFVDLVYAIISGLMVAAFLFIRNVAQTAGTVELKSRDQAESDEVRIDADLPPATFVLDLNGAFFFGAASKFEAGIRPLLPRAQTLILRMREVTLLDATGTRILARILKDAQAKRVRVMVTEVQPPILQVLEHADLIHQIGVSNIFASFDGALRELRSSQPLVFSTRDEDATKDPI